MYEFCTGALKVGSGLGYSVFNVSEIVYCYMSFIVICHTKITQSPVSLIVNRRSFLVADHI